MVGKVTIWQDGVMVLEKVLYNLEKDELQEELVKEWIDEEVVHWKLESGNHLTQSEFEQLYLRVKKCVDGKNTKGILY